MGEAESSAGKPPRSPSREDITNVTNKDTSQTSESSALTAPDVQDAKAILDAAKKAAAEEHIKQGDGGGDKDVDLEAAPLHLHTLRQPPLLQGIPSIRSRSRSTSRSRTSSRDVSPSPSQTSAGGGGGGHHHRKSSIGLGTPADPIPGTLEEPPSYYTNTQTTASSTSGGSDAGSDIDPDILLDKLGFDDLEPPAPHKIAEGDLALGSSWAHSSQPLPSLNERMSEESLDDTRAFQDLVSTLHTSLRGQDEISEEIEALGTLQEDDESEEEEDSGGEDDGTAQHPAMQVLDDLLAKTTDPDERTRLLKLKREHSDKIRAAITSMGATTTKE